MKTPVLVTAIITGGAVVIALILAVVAVIDSGHDATPLLTMFSAANLIAIISGILYVVGRIKVIEQNTNHTQDKLVDAVIASPPVVKVPDES